MLHITGGNMSEVQLDGNVQAYGAVKIVHGADLEVDEEEFVVLEGPLKYGKSTTLRINAGLEKISHGTPPRLSAYRWGHGSRRSFPRPSGT